MTRATIWVVVAHGIRGHRPHHHVVDTYWSEAAAKRAALNLAKKQPKAHVEAFLVTVKP